MADDKLSMLIATMTIKLGRLPTEDEVIEFIEGDTETRTKIWNQFGLTEEKNERG